MNITRLLLLIMMICFLGCQSDTQPTQDKMSDVDMSRNSSPATPDIGIEMNLDMTLDRVDMSDLANIDVDQRMTEVSDMQVTPTVNTDPFDIMIHDQDRIVSYGDENFQNIFGDFDLGDGPFESVTLVVDLGTTCYPFERWREDPPPSGHNWPPNCDAFDRNFEIVIDPTQEENDPPGIEVMRAITPFGGPSHYEIDLTDFANIRPGQHRIHTHITTWSDHAGQVSGSQGGWDISLKLHVVPGTAPRSVIALIPLMNTRINATGELPRPGFNIPAGVQSTRLEYRVTGHGGGNDPSNRCIGPAEEFCQREHVVYVDGMEKERFTPWRDNCADMCTLETQRNGNDSFEYCLENPTGSIRSVRAPRANWCPGALTPPKTWDFDEYHQEGRHSFQFDIRNVYEGGSWRVSAHLYLFAD